MTSLYKTPVTNLNGIGEKRAALFARLGIKSVGDLINFYPRTYEDWSNIKHIDELEYGETVCIKAVVATSVNDTRISGGRIISKTAVYDETGSIQLVFFNNKYISSMLRQGGEYFFYGKISSDSYGMQIVSPTFAPAVKGTQIRPIYRQTAGLPSKSVESAVRQALSMLPSKIKDPLPDAIRERFDLCSLRQALFDIHFPKNRQQLEAARKRLVTEELVVLNLGMRNLRDHSRGVTSLEITKDYSKEFESLLPFTMTNAQKRAVSDCINDIINKSSPLNRLVQGDVGSGKTAVAASVCYTVAKNGFQTAFMAPTEILARQHYKTFQKLFENTESEKKQIRKSLADGSIDMVIGTHALITDKTEFKNLALAVTDEQHRFGVAQRAKLLGKGNNPHLLVMSATPIPRTLGLIIFGDLDISIIDELPPSRKPVKTVLRTSAMRGGVYDFIRSEVKHGRQAYIVCPLVEEGELDDVASAEEYAADLMLREFPDIGVGMVHGQMKSDEKDEVMRKFVENEYSVLVATTVIEVGVDVPNATVIVIENAERFGLSQLHQLRGRVGRGAEQSYCILVTDYKITEETRKRIQIMVDSNDGFEIAEQDLKLRGPGDLEGTQQSGTAFDLKIANLAKDGQILQLARDTASEIVENDPEQRNPENQIIWRRLKELQSGKINWGAIS